MNGKILIAHFSREGNNYVGGNMVNLPVGNTEVAANIIAERAGGYLLKLDPVKKYSGDYQICTEEAKKELDSDARPVLLALPDSIDDYNTIILGYPNWWGTMPMPVWTFLESFDFSGKTILPFCTHEGRGMGRSEADIRKLCHNAKLGTGLAIRGSNVNNAKKDIENWLKKHGL